jgi:perosamine synthetase
MNYNGWDREYLENKSEYQKLFDEVMQVDNDRNVEFLEKRIADYSNRRYAVAVSSATDALYYSLLCYGIGPGDDVLVSDFSWISTASCISMTGANPIFCDIDLESYHISIESIQENYTSKTKALIYTHLFGNMTDTKEIQDFCKEKGIAFIEDAAQSLGSSLNGVKAGSIGDVSSYSFNNNKVIAGISGGGMLMTDNEDFAKLVRKLRRHGKDKDYEILGYNSKMFYMNAAFINFRLNKMEEWQRRRQSIAMQYEDFFYALPIHFQTMGNGLNHNYHKYVIRFEIKEERDLMRKQLNATVHYDKPISENSKYKSIGKPNAKIVSDTVLSLPIHPWLTDQEINMIGLNVSMNDIRAS